MAPDSSLPQEAESLFRHAAGKDGVMADTVRVTIDLPKAMIEELDAMAKDQGRSPHDVLRRLVKRQLGGYQKRRAAALAATEHVDHHFAA
jgi:hypothetical protein